MKKMLMVATVPSMIGQFNSDNLSILMDLGYEPHVACNFNDGGSWSTDHVEKFKAEMKSRNIPCHQIDFSRSPWNIKNIIFSYKRMKQLVADEKYDLIHCHAPVAAVISRIVAHQRKVKIIYTAHGFHFYKGAPLKNWLLFYPIEKLLSRWTDVLITINHEDYTVAKSRFHAKKTLYVPGVGVDTDRFCTCNTDAKTKRKELGVPSDAFVLLSVIEPMDWENYRVVFDALYKLNNPDIYYLIVGAEKFKIECEDLIEQYKLQKNIKLLGCQADIDELCEAADCLVQLSFQEELGITMLEAMAGGLPVVFFCADERGNFEKDNVKGYCIRDLTSIDEMAVAIQKMYINLDFRNKCGLDNQKAIRNISIADADEMIKHLYSKNGYKILQSLLIRQKKRKEFGFTLDDFVIISVGELNDNKNHEVIIKALENLKNSAVKYIICGIGIKEEYLREMICKKGLEKQVYLLGFRNDIKDLLYMSDVFAFPSKREGLGLAAIEAMAAGLPLVTSNIHGIKDYSVNEISGYSNNSSDVEGFAHSLEKCILNEEQLIHFGNYNRMACKKYDIAYVRERMKEIYSLVVE